MTALMAAAAGGKADVVRLLLERGADANLRGAKGMTASGWAMDHGHAELAKVLRDAEVKPPPGPANPLAPPIPAPPPGPPTPTTDPATP
jgi:ankyrin repeat protein